MFYSLDRSNFRESRYIDNIPKIQSSISHAGVLRFTKDLQSEVKADANLTIQSDAQWKKSMRSLILVFVMFISACAHYTTPGGSVRLNQLVDQDINKVLSQKPLAEFPVNLAIVRIQSSGYENYRTDSFGTGQYSIITTREVESEESFERLMNLPQVEAVAPINRIFLPSNLESIKVLRLAAARLKADILLLYTFDTSFHIGSQKFGPLNVISLGFLDNKEITVTTTVSAAFFDVRSEYLYGLSEASAKEKNEANSWGNQAVVDDLRVITEKAAYEKLLTEIETTWSGIVQQYAL